MHDAEVINLISKLFSHGAQFCYHLYTQWVMKMQGTIMASFVTWPLIWSKLAQVATINEHVAVCETTCKTTCKKSAQAEHDALDTHMQYSPLALLPTCNGKQHFANIMDDESMQVTSSLTSLHSTSPVACFHPDPHQPPLTYGPQSINTPMWNGIRLRRTMHGRPGWSQKWPSSATATY